ncbi:TBC1 domain family member 31 [Erpetoichthys calabaricus]|uniref:TBC1 domain family member 31 n=1 Tax=Erpetoichthys calabaricus TaxID=27687 RepID=UPI002234006D|nr:TBC1 domain family member 31 [Erpetoichthys calabaricus]
MQTTDIGSKEHGKIWHRKPIPSLSDGVIVNVFRSAGGIRTKTIRFLHVAFSTTGDAFLAGDHHGNIYMFDISRNKFTLVQKTGQACTALAFCLRRGTEYLVALADYSIKCYDTATKELVSWMRGHESSVSSISVHGSGRFAITTSSDTAQLWDLDTFQRKRKLNVRQTVGIQKVFFLPLSNIILSCFKDGSIFAWESDTLHCKYQMPEPDEGQKLHYKSFAVTRDGRMLVAGGKSNFLHLWCLDNKQLLRIIQMPPKVRTVRHVEFLPDPFDGGSSQILGCLSQDGIMRFINIQTCKLIFDIGSLDNGISSAVISPNGHHIVALMENGSLNIYSVQSLTQDVNKPPPPLVKVVEQSNVSKPSKQASYQRMKTKPERPPKSSGETIKARVPRPPFDSTLTDKENELPEGLNKKRLQAMLKEFGEYPTKYRMFVWRSLLRLPENHAAYSSLIDKGPHSAYQQLHQEYPIKSQRLERILQRILSALAHWSAIFGETRYLPLVAFPFVKLFQNNQLICFEVIATFIMNWCQHWFEYFPNPPLNVLSMIENIISHHDKELLQHFVKCNITSQIYAWPLLETVFSEVLTRDEWLKLFDNIFSNHPSFLLMVNVSYIISSRSALLHCSLKEDFEYYFHHHNTLDINSVIKEAYRLMETTPKEIHPSFMLDDFEPLTRGQYPVFNKYPAFIVDYQSQERERIRLQELEYLKERQITHELQAEAVRRKAADDAWYRQQELLQEAEEQRRKLLLEEEQKLMDQRSRLAAMKRELKIKELHLLEAARRRFLKYQQDQKKMELRRLDDEINRKASLREQETANVVQDIEVRQMELETQRRILEQELTKEQEKINREIKGQVDAMRRKAEVEDSMMQSLIDTDVIQDSAKKKILEESLAEAGRLCEDTNWQVRMLQRQRMADMDRERHYQELAHLAEETRKKEGQLIDLMQEVQGIKWEEVVEKKAQLEEEMQASALAEARRNQFLTRGMENVVQQRQNASGHSESSSERLCDLRVKPSCSTKCKIDHTYLSPHQNICINDVSSSDSSVHFISGRGRREFENRERELMNDVRELRQKLVSQARRKAMSSFSSISQSDYTI